MERSTDKNQKATALVTRLVETTNTHWYAAWFCNYVIPAKSILRTITIRTSKKEQSDRESNLPQIFFCVELTLIQFFEYDLFSSDYFFDNYANAWIILFLIFSRTQKRHDTILSTREGTQYFCILFQKHIKCAKCFVLKIVQNNTSSSKQLKRLYFLIYIQEFFINFGFFPIN